MLNPSIRPFHVLLLGQTISMFGSVLTGFALAVWAYKQSDSPGMTFAAIVVANSLPVLLLGPIAGAAADRWNRKKIILASQFSAISITAALTLLYYLKILEIWHIISLVALNSVFMAFVLPTVTATVPLMVPKGYLTRANALIALAFGIIELFSRVISGSLYEHYGLMIIFFVDLCTFAIGLGAVIITKIPQPPKSKTLDEDLEKETFFESIRFGYQFITSNSALLLLMFFFAGVAACIQAIGIMVQPMILGFADAQELGIIMSIAGSGMLFGAIAMIPFKDVSKHMPIIFSITFVIGISCILTPVTSNAIFITIGGFVLMACFPVIDTHCRALFQRKVDSMMLGRIVGFRNFLLGILQTTLVFGSGYLADNIFEPAMMPDTLMVPMLGEIYGTGKGRGFAVLISAIGIGLLAFLFIAMTSSRLRHIDTALDDVEVDLNTLNNE